MFFCGALLGNVYMVILILNPCLHFILRLKDPVQSAYYVRKTFLNNVRCLLENAYFGLSTI